MIASPVAESGPWSLGTLVGLPIAILAALALVASGAWMVKRSRTADHIDALPLKWLAIGCYVAAALIAVATASPLGMYPYDSEYHQWRDVTGTVERVESRQIADGEGMSERYVFVIDGQPFSVDDTRAAVANKGDTVSLRCKREWQYAAASGWACRWSGHE